MTPLNEERLQITKIILTHVVAVGLILVFITLLIMSIFDKTIVVPAILISLGSGAVGFYISGIKQNHS